MPLRSAMEIFLFSSYRIRKITAQLTIGPAPIKRIVRILVTALVSDSRKAPLSNTIPIIRVPPIENTTAQTMHPSVIAMVDQTQNDHIFCALFSLSIRLLKLGANKNGPAQTTPVNAITSRCARAWCEMTFSPRIGAIILSTTA